jgi:hypothetical protein
VKYGGVPHFGATQTTLLRLDCNSLEYKTASPFSSKF